MSTAQNQDQVKTKTPPKDATPAAGVIAAVGQLGAKMDALTAKVGDNEAIQAQLDGVKTAVDQIAASAEKWTKDGPPADWTGAVDAMAERLDGFEARLAMPGVAGADGAKTVGEIIHEDAGFKSGYIGADGHMAIPRGQYGPGIKVPSLLGHQAHGAKTGEIMHSIAPNPAVRGSIFTPSLDQMNLGQRIPYVPAPGATSWMGARESEASVHGFVTTTLAADVTNPSTTATVADPNGFLPNTWIRFFNSTGGRLKRVRCLDVNYTTGVITFDTGALDFAATTGWRVIGENFGAVEPTDLKHYGHLEVEPFVETFKTLPTMMAVTEQMLATVPALTAWVEDKLKTRAQRNLSHHILHGDGTAPRQLSGFDNAVGAQSYAWSSGSPGDTMVDAIIRAAAMVPWAGEVVVVMNKLDMMKIATTKATDGHYLKSTILGDVTLTPLLGRMMIGPWELILDDAVAETDFYVVNLAEASELVDQQTSQLKWGYIGNQFGENAITARYEDNLIHSIQSTGAYVIGDFDNPPATP